MKARVLIYDLDRGTEGSPGTRGPAWHLNGSGKRVFDNPIAIIWDPGDLGVGDWVNTPGTMFFTLPVNHPQVDLIEPMQVHYRVEIKHNDVWEALDDNTDGLITKVDATENEVVIYGLNYVGLLDRTFEQRFKPKLGPDVPINKGGSKYVNKTIDYAVKDQLAVEAAIPSSPVGFIVAPTLPGWTEKITIYSVFKQRLQFIAGLMDSHIADTNRRPRLRVERNSNHAGYNAATMNEQYQWVFGDVPGIALDDLKLEYGALVNGFRVVPIDDNFATKGLGVGRTQTGTLPQYATSVPVLEGGGSFPTWNWGSFPIVSIFDEIIDANDLKRRTARLARRAGQFGQAVGLALSVGGVEPVRQWTLLDRFPVVIDRGVIHTELYNDGYWTAVGWSWRLFRDGHDELVITLEPHDTLSTSITSDLIPADPVSPSGPVRVGCGEPEINDTYNERIYYDRCSGLTYVLEDCDEVQYVAQSVIETFTRTLDPWVANDSEFITHGVTRAWGAASGPLAADMMIDGSTVRVPAASSASDASRYAEAQIDVLADDLATPVEVLVKWIADMPTVSSAGNSSCKASVKITVAGRSFDMEIQARDFGASNVYDNGDVLEAIQVNLKLNGSTIVYSGLGSSVPLGTSETAFRPYHDPEQMLVGRLRVEQAGTDVLMQGKMWFEDESEPAEWLYELSIPGAAVDLTTTPLVMRIRPYKNPASGPENGLLRTTYVDSIELLTENRDYIGLPDVPHHGTFSFPWYQETDTDYIVTPETDIVMSAVSLRDNGVVAASSPARVVYVQDVWPVTSPDGASAIHMVPGYDSGTLAAYHAVGVVQFVLPEETTVARLTGAIRALTAAFNPLSADLPYKIAVLNPSLDFDAMDDPAGFVQDDLDLTAGTIIFEGTIPMGWTDDSGTDLRLVPDLDVQFLASGTIQIAIFYERNEEVNLWLSGALDLYKGNTDYCWGVKPPVPWHDGDPTYPFPTTGQIVPRHKVATGNALAQYFYTTIRGLYLPFDPDAVAIPYQPGSLRVDVDGLYVNLAESDPTTGLFFLPFAPESDEDVFAEWRTG
jgi:hypothetical protein